MEKQVKKTIAFIPVRGGSKSIPLKNIKQICGKPLVQWAIEAANDCNYIDEIVVSTDSTHIKDTVANIGVSKLKVINRSPETATDYASSELPLLEYANLEADRKDDIIILIQATSPLLSSEDLTKALELFHKSDADSMLSVVRQKRFLWKEINHLEATPVNYDPTRRPRRQDYEGFLVENGAFYITYRKNLLQSQCRISGKIAYYEMPEYTYYEVDEPHDWIIVEKLLGSKVKNNYRKTIDQKLKRIKLLVTDCDGVLTDGGMYYSEKGDELKKFNTRDGMGLGLLRQHGILTAIITGENVGLVVTRANKMKIDYVYCGIKNKLETLEKIINQENLTFDQVAYIGDDINDLEVMKKVGLSFAVNDAMDIIKKNAHYVTQLRGGQGAVREVCEMILEAQISS